MSKISPRISVGGFLCFALAAPAFAQWTYTDVHPVGATNSAAWAVSVGNWAVGSREDVLPAWGFTYSGLHALIWQGSATTDVTPVGGSAALYGTDGTNSVGGALISGEVAGLWMGTTFTNLNPRGATQSMAYALYTDQQVGWALFPEYGVNHAMLWRSGARNFTDLNPAGALYGTSASGIYGGTQVGSIKPASWNGSHACRWLGTAASFLDMQPGASNGSSAISVWGSAAVGLACNIDRNSGAITDRRAYVWNTATGTSYSIHPVSAVQSSAQSIYNNAVVGTTINSSGVSKAWFWNLATGTNTDLSAFLVPGFYTNSVATSAWTNGQSYRVSGYATYVPTGKLHAIVWTNAGFPQP